MISDKVRNRSARFDRKKHNKRMKWAWKVLGFEGPNPGIIPKPKKRKRRKVAI